MVGVYRPATLHEALSLRDTKDTLVLAGGTDLMVKHRAMAGTLPSFRKEIVVIGHLSELKEIGISADVAHIGAACTLADILAEPLLPEYVKLPIASIGSPAIRNMATIGGNICNASPAADSLCMLYALDAVLVISSIRGRRECPIQDFITGPGMNTLEKGEILKEVVIPLRLFNRLYYVKAGQRKSNAIAKVSLFAVANVVDGIPEDIRMAFGAVAPVTARSREAELTLITALQSKKEDFIKDALAAFDGLIKPIDDVRSNSVYRRNVAMRLAEHFIREEIGE